MERKLSRRNFLTRTAAIGAGAAAAAVVAKNASAQIKNEPVTNKPFVDQYYEGMLKIAKDIRATQVPNISKAASTAYDLKQKGGRLSCSFQTGHFVMFAASADVPGQPGIFPNDHGGGGGGGGAAGGGQRAAGAGGAAAGAGGAAGGGAAGGQRAAGAGGAAAAGGAAGGGQRAAGAGGAAAAGGAAGAGQRGGGMGKGDFTFGMGGGNATSRANGLYVVGVTNSYSVTKHTPQGALSRTGAPMEDSCDLVIDSQQPWQNGLVRVPWIDNFHVMPSCGNAMMLVYWSVTAAVANLIGTKGKGSATTPVEQYLDLAIERITKLGNDRAKMTEVTSKWVDNVVSDKARCLVYGHRQLGTNYQGCTNMFVNECYEVADGTAWADQYELHDAAHAKDLRKNDVVLIGGFTSNNADEIFVAQTAKRAGAYTTAFCPFATDGDASGYRLSKEVDSSFDTYSDESAGVIQVPGYSYKIAPLSGIIGNVAHWMLMSAWCDNMWKRGMKPNFWQGFHEAGGNEYDKVMQEDLKKVGY